MRPASIDNRSSFEKNKQLYLYSGLGFLGLLVLFWIGGSLLSSGGPLCERTIEDEGCKGIEKSVKSHLVGMVRVVQAETLDEDASLEKIEKAHAEALRVADLENLMSSNVDVPDARGTYSDYYEITSEVDDLIVYFRAKPKYERVHGYTSFMRVPHLGVWSAVSGMCKSTDLGDSAPNPTVIKGDYSCR